MERENDKVIKFNKGTVLYGDMQDKCMKIAESETGYDEKR